MTICGFGLSAGAASDDPILNRSSCALGKSRHLGVCVFSHGFEIDHLRAGSAHRRHRFNERLQLRVLLAEFDDLRPVARSSQARFDTLEAIDGLR